MGVCTRRRSIKIWNSYLPSSDYPRESSLKKKIATLYARQTIRLIDGEDKAVLSADEQSSSDRLFYSLYHDKMEEMRNALLMSRKYPNAEGVNFAPLIMYITAWGLVDTVRRLLEPSSIYNTGIICDVNVRGMKKAASALHHACSEGHKDVVRLLLSYGAKVNAEDVDKTSPLTEAALRDRFEVMEILLANGANPEHALNTGYGTLKNGHRDVIDFLKNQAMMQRDRSVVSVDANESRGNPSDQDRQAVNKNKKETKSS